MKPKYAVTVIDTIGIGSVFIVKREDQTRILWRESVRQGTPLVTAVANLVTDRFMALEVTTPEMYYPTWNVEGIVVARSYPSTTPIIVHRTHHTRYGTSYLVVGSDIQGVWTLHWDQGQYTLTKERFDEVNIDGLGFLYGIRNGNRVSVGNWKNGRVQKTYDFTKSRHPEDYFV